ncbi:antibiotic biosynthesis monooxygenase [Polyangium aurulentum]|uniref:antibiotic biosynthesis monooxygenase n=1 Tax=Polyangium aurulentum TaxID=2567896 RepID=UPI0010ADEE86|nr:antibiotic biosynthesis monooxygenase [Polyangium aurulentum]UQA55468.1 antibiotic biosynthesis monooxygenase [Polyangium aurulentum]
MSRTIHVAITRRVRREHAEAFAQALADFARRSLTVPGALGVHLLHPAPGSDSTEYGILRSFASAEDREAFYKTDLYKEWVAQIAHMVDGEPIYRELGGLEAWFRHPHAPPPPRWKMALLTWIAVWPVSMLVAAVIAPLLGPRLPPVLTSGVIAGGIVITLTWGAMPLLVKLAKNWLQPKQGDQ